MEVRDLRTVLLAAAAALTLTACGGAAATPKPVSNAPAASTPAVSQPVAPTVKVTKAAVALKGAGGSAVTGTATLEQTDDKVTYRVTVTAAEVGPHALYIFQGTACDGKGNRTGPLAALEASGDGNGVAEGTMQAQLGTLVGRSIALYASDKGDSDIVSCGPITAAQ